MDANTKIHLLSKELIPVINDIDNKPKQIILDHIIDCEDCRNLYNHSVEFDENMPKNNYSNDVELKPLKKLVQFNTGLKLLLIAVRAIILFYILYSSFKYYNVESVIRTLDYFWSVIFLFYIPAAVFLLVFTITFFNKKWIWMSLIVDLFIIVFLGNILQLFL
ncbi:hypothetical protein [Oceanobacillus iheyensis HTE831]|uniref:Uncharacterized protein n=1 Tax=Oceanobacillus iheyensis (strain DSM 14371 / CIP 107618 / JCM 11309 / KCTC 3954 / HTE831) TaxID=221109 RepID=Q8ERQ2_OCEIH|nr:hypothetical protein [Oceanobacillus iheyensis]BAC13205.1 hypothetical protein [Oceanobacillus iheyensis HTE831]